jgi:hypothetical protein
VPPDHGLQDAKNADRRSAVAAMQKSQFIALATKAGYTHGEATSVYSAQGAASVLSLARTLKKLHGKRTAPDNDAAVQKLM